MAHAAGDIAVADRAAVVPRQAADIVVPAHGDIAQPQMRNVAAELPEQSDSIAEKVGGGETRAIDE